MQGKSVKIDAAVHQAAKLNATNEGMSLGEWITKVIRKKLEAPKREMILDAFAVNPLLKEVYAQIPFKDMAVYPSAIINEICGKDPKISEGRIYEAIEKLKELELIREIPLTPEPPLRDRVVYRRLEDLDFPLNTNY